MRCYLACGKTDPKGFDGTPHPPLRGPPSPEGKVKTRRPMGIRSRSYFLGLLRKNAGFCVSSPSPLGKVSRPKDVTDEGHTQGFVLSPFVEKTQIPSHSFLTRGKEYSRCRAGAFACKKAPAANHRSSTVEREAETPPPQGNAEFKMQNAE